VLNLFVQNDCLLTNHLHKIYNHANLPCVKLAWELYYPYALPPARPREIFFWWRDFLKVLPKFKHLVIYNCVQENSILLWKDIWTDVPLQDTWPRLLSVAKNGFISLKYALAAPDISVLFHLPVSKEAMVQLTLFQTVTRIHTNKWL
jgi:hypothetical protein